ncbi:MAG: polyketide synthase, partial [Anaerolineales bacterium]|nr:polyketide synthase [Anaerolineales bacterium]
IRSEGVGVVVLKPLAAAQRDGDRVLAVIRGTAVNQDGPSSGLTVPNKLAQEAVIRAALTNAGVAPAAVSYVEAHGTGTSLGDPIEVRALAAVLGAERTQPFYLGSVKTNIGHTESAAGVAGLIKVVLSMQHDELPPHLHFQTPTPHVDWQTIPAVVPTRRTPWSGTARVAGISAFGASGTNAHVIVAAPPVVEDAAVAERPYSLLPLSAKSEPALRELAARYA